MLARKGRWHASGRLPAIKGHPQYASAMTVGEPNSVARSIAQKDKNDPMPTTHRSRDLTIAFPVLLTAQLGEEDETGEAVAGLPRTTVSFRGWC